jgi:hypothetical protein
MKTIVYLLPRPGRACAKTRAYEVSVRPGTRRVLRIGVSSRKFSPSAERATRVVVFSPWK